MVTFSLICFVDQFRRTFSAVDQKQNYVLRCVAVCTVLGHGIWAGHVPSLHSGGDYFGVFFILIVLLCIVLCWHYCKYVRISIALAIAMLCRTNYCATKEKQTTQQQENTSTDMTCTSHGLRPQWLPEQRVREKVKKYSATLSSDSKRGIRAADPNRWYYTCMYLTHSFAHVQMFQHSDNNNILFIFPGANNSLLLSFRNKERFELSPLFYTLPALNRRSPSAVQEYIRSYHSCSVIIKHLTGGLKVTTNTF